MPYFPKSTYVLFVGLYFLCSVLRLNPVFQPILSVTFHNEIGTSEWGLEGAKNSTQKSHLTFFFIPHIWLLKKLRFLEWHGISRCGIFPIARNVKTQKLDKIEHFLSKNMQFTKLLIIYTNIVTHVFLSRPSTGHKN